MSGPCLCGDTACPYCGAAQGTFEYPADPRVDGEIPSCPACGVEALTRSRSCGATICLECNHHVGLVRCYCGWAADGGDGRQQLIDLGETI